MMSRDAASRTARLAVILLLGTSWLGTIVGCPSPEDSSTGKPDMSGKRETAIDSSTGGEPGRAEAEPAAILDIPLPDITNLDEAVRKQLQQAQSALSQLRQKPGVSDSRLGRSYGEMGMLYHAYRLYDAAEACYKNARTLQPEALRWPYYLGDIHLQKGDSEKEAATYENALAMDADYVPALINLAHNRLSANKPDEAEPLFKKALVADPVCAAAHAGLGEIALLREEHETAARYFENALRLQPSATIVHYSLAMAYRGLKENEKAREHLARRGYTKASVSDPLMAALNSLSVGSQRHMEIAADASKSGKVALALQELRKAVRAAPEDPMSRIGLAITLAQIGNHDGAAEQFREAIRLKPNSARAHRNFAVMLAKKGDDGAAMDHYLKAVACDPQHAGSQLGLADLALKMGKQELASTHYELAEQIDPRHPVPKKGKIVILAKEGKYAEAFDYLEEANELIPNNLTLTHVAARLLATCPDEQFRDGTKALSLAKTVFGTRQTIEHGETLAMAFAETGCYDEAQRWQKMAIEVAETEDRHDALPRLKKNLDLYESGKPCRTPW